MVLPRRANSQVRPSSGLRAADSAPCEGSCICVKGSGHPHMLPNTGHRSTLLKLLLCGTLSGVAFHPPLPFWHAPQILEFWPAS